MGFSINNFPGGSNPSTGVVSGVMAPVAVTDFAPGETFTIGADTYVAANPVVGAWDFLIGATITATLDNLAAKINASSTENVMAIGPATLGSDDIVLLNASAPGGSPSVGRPGSRAVSTTCATCYPDNSNMWNNGSAISTNIGHGSTTFDVNGQSALAAGRNVFLGQLPWAASAASVIKWEVIDGSGTHKNVTDKVVFNVSGAVTAVFAIPVGATHAAAGDTVNWVAVQ